MQNTAIDNGRAFDWGRTSADYARYRDIYPPAFYRRLLDAGLCAAGLRVLEGGPYDHFEHWVEQAVTRDVAVAVRP